MKIEGLPWCWPLQFQDQHWHGRHSWSVCRWNCPPCWLYQLWGPHFSCSSATPSGCLPSRLREMCDCISRQWNGSEDGILPCLCSTHLIGWWRSTHHPWKQECCGPGNRLPAPPWQAVLSALQGPVWSEQEETTSVTTNNHSFNVIAV